MTITAAPKTLSQLQVSWKPLLARIGRKIFKYRWLYLMMLPGIIYFILFRYLPLMECANRLQGL